MQEHIRKRVHTQLSGELSEPQSSQLAEPLSTDPGLKSGINVRERKKRENEWSNILPKSSQARKKPPIPPQLVGSSSPAISFLIKFNVLKL